MEIGAYAQVGKGLVTFFFFFRLGPQDQEKLNLPRLDGDQLDYHPRGLNFELGAEDSGQNYGGLGVFWVRGRKKEASDEEKNELSQI